MRTSLNIVVLIFTVLVLGLKATDHHCLEAKKDGLWTRCCPGKKLAYGKCIDESQTSNLYIYKSICIKE
jgi:hypothetical protein